MIETAAIHSTGIKTAGTVQELRTIIAGWRQCGHTVALVPTMGALHEGHLDLVRAALRHADKVVASIFVNPTQFAAHEDLARYPRTLESDSAMLALAGCDLIYAPNAATMYPDGFSTAVSVSGVTAPLEGQFRPHFFGGVTTVVAKLFIQADPDFALFGEKDWQQLQVVTKMAADLDMDISVVGVPTRREVDGLAMSSRNSYLTAQQRAIAPALKQALDHIWDAITLGSTDITCVVDQAKAALLGRGFASIDYLCACHAQTLQPWTQGDPLRILGAAWLGQTRLIDNCGA